MDEKVIRKRLISEIERVEKQITRYEGLSGPVAPDNAIGRVSRMDAINNKSVVDAALLKAREKHSGLKRHLDTLGSPDFGVCRKCGASIPIERILLAPESSFCVTCAR